jgi:hypothetical protein
VDENQKHRKITFYKNYFQDFFSKQSKKVKAKIVWTFDLVEDLQRVPETYLKHIENTDGLYERFSKENTKDNQERNRKGTKNKS